MADPQSKSERVAASRRAIAAAHAADPASTPRFEARMANLAAVRRRDRDQGGSWCILRTNGRRTLKLAASLTAAGIEAWSPCKTVKRRLARGRRIAATGFREQDEPIVPSFVFARAEYLPDLLRILGLPNNPHPDFSIFQMGGRAPIIADREVRYLHDAEERARRARLREQRPDLAVGTTIRPNEGAFAGLEGVVEFVKGGRARVCFGGHFRVQVETWQIVDDAVHGVNINGRQDRQRVTGLELVD